MIVTQIHVTICENYFESPVERKREEIYINMGSQRRLVKEVTPKLTPGWLVWGRGAGRECGDEGAVDPRELWN